MRKILIKEQRTFCLKLKALGESGEFSGYASTFGNLDLGGDIVEAGAFKKTLKESRGKVPILDHHDPERQIGWNMSAEEDAHGLRVTGKLDLNVQLARERYSLMQLAQEVGADTGLSIGYQTIKSEPDRLNPQVRRLKEIRLLEYSIVVFPMNPEAGIATVKQSVETHGHASLQLSLIQLVQQIKNINQEYSQWKS